MWDALHCCCTSADDRDTFIGEADETSVRVASGVVIVPSTGVEHVTFKGSDPSDSRQFWTVERAGCKHDDVCRHLIISIGEHGPARFAVVPLHRGHTGLKTRVVVKVEVASDTARMLHDLRSERILVLRHCAEFF